ncbi:MAG: signal recognition particle-docking protein FtsY [Clostridiales bacterium]|nr:signal recognition particle-docking protein FtsY [Clostridiales bacterium]
MGMFSKFFGALKKTKDAISKKITQIFVGELDDDFYEELEFVLVSSDIGTEASAEIVDNVRALAKKNKVKTEEEFKEILREAMSELLTFDEEELAGPTLYTIVGVNGVGKTTAIGKLAYRFKKEKKSVLMVAGDTFRAAASEQLYEWSKRAGTRIVKYAEGADPGAVVYDGIKSAVAKKDDIVLVDTAGRLHNKVGLMEELKKIGKIIAKEWQGNTQTYLVIDATTGQNALQQVEVFNEIMPLDGIILTKLDGSSKGGVVFAIAKKYGIPIKFVGVGESVDDIEPFNAEEFVKNII